ncbi:hypothetical protein [Absidia glauca]|uniref:Uncharacterized protein n=1 Tax=Absidia glauca TaxID=4829 RepID=A0A163KMS3_ABSGL|nr:hypothetical protein [Absidia glauca]
MHFPAQNVVAMVAHEDYGAKIRKVLEGHHIVPLNFDPRHDTLHREDRGNHPSHHHNKSYGQLTPLPIATTIIFWTGLAKSYWQSLTGNLDTSLAMPPPQQRLEQGTYTASID